MGLELAFAPEGRRPSICWLSIGKVTARRLTGKAGIFFLPTRLNFVSPHFEYLPEAYVAEMNAAMIRAGSPATLTMATVSNLEDLAQEKYFDFRAKADSMVSKGHAKPMYDPTQFNR
jgi:hypothetical protein